MTKPLAARMRPRSIDEIVGQAHVLSDTSLLRQAWESGELFSMIVWGPPGCGKTSLGYLMGERSELPFHHMSAVGFSVRDFKDLVGSAAGDIWGGRMILFLDEIHRLNKAQQDILLPHVEEGTVTLFGATTENPAFEVNRALLSRCRVFRLEPLAKVDLERLITRALADPDRGLGKLRQTIDNDARDALLRYSGGDARAILNILEAASKSALRTHDSAISLDRIKEAAGALSVHHDKGGEEHYNVISAFIKSMRGGDPDATLYYLARMIEGGEDPRYIVRRVLICASEDVGLADPVPLMVATAAAQAFDYVGMPEGRLILAHAALTVCLAPKSNASYAGINAAQRLVREGAGRHPVPLQLHGALGPEDELPTEYRYPHDFPGNHVQQTYLPDAVADAILYNPGDQGREVTIRKYLERWWKGAKAYPFFDEEPSRER